MKLKVLGKLVMFISLISLVACGVSEEEKQERQANAFDVSGGWMTSDSLGLPSSGLQDEVTLFISNEGDDRSNIKIEVIRDAWSSQENNFFENFAFSFSQMERIRNKFDGSFIIGTGKHQDLIGGENISDNFGESSKIYVSSNHNESVKFSDGTNISYAIEAVVDRDDFILRGKLHITVSQSREERDTSGQLIYVYETLGNHTINFNARNETIYYQQYFGAWTGRAELSTDFVENLSQLTQIDIRKYDDEIFTIRPNISQLIYRGEIFEIQNKFYDLLELKLVRFPTLDFTYIGDRGNVIHFGGSVRSLGHFSGSIEYISERDIETIGYFDFKRQ